MNTRHLLAGAIWMQGLLVSAQTDTLQSQSLDDVTVTARQGGTLRMSGAENGKKLGGQNSSRLHVVIWERVSPPTHRLT